MDRQTVISSKSSYPTGELLLSELSKITVTVALSIPAKPFLYIRSCKFAARTFDKDEIPITKQRASKMLDFPEPLNPVIALK